MGRAAPLLRLALVWCAAARVRAAPHEALELRPAALGATLSVARQEDGHLAVGALAGAALHADYSWKGGWPSTAAEVPLDPGLRRLHLSGGRSGLLLRVEAEAAECNAGGHHGATLGDGLRRTICAALRDPEAARHFQLRCICVGW